MTPAAVRARLDRSLAYRGEDVILRRRIPNTSPTAYAMLTCRAFVRGYEPHEVVGSITYGDTKLVISPSAILANPSAWPGLGGGAVLPKNPDQISVQGIVRTVITAAPIYQGGELVRIDAQVRG